MLSILFNILMMIFPTEVSLTFTLFIICKNVSGSKNLSSDEFKIIKCREIKLDSDNVFIGPYTTLLKRNTEIFKATKM